MEYLSTLNFSVDQNDTFDKNGTIDHQHQHHHHLTHHLEQGNGSTNYRDVNKVLIDSFQRNRNIEDPAYNILIVMYSFLILFGAIGNFLVVLAVVRKPVMRTARNMFIVNLAVSGNKCFFLFFFLFANKYTLKVVYIFIDLVLCLVTMPLTLVEILTKFWPLGKYAVLCKMIGTLQATTIFVSTISITSIALDRYQVCFWFYIQFREYMKQDIPRKAAQFLCFVHFIYSARSYSSVLLFKSNFVIASIRTNDDKGLRVLSNINLSVLGSVCRKFASLYPKCCVRIFFCKI